MLYTDRVGVFNPDLAEVTGGVNEKRSFGPVFLIKNKINIKNKKLYDKR